MVLPYESMSYDGEGAKTISELTDVELTNLSNGEILKYNGTNFINFAPTYLDGAGIPDNYLIKVVGGVTTQTSFTESSVLNTSTSLQTYIPLGILSVLAGSIETEIFNGTKTRMHLTTSGKALSSGITITSDGRVGIGGVIDPQEDLEIDGNIQLDTGGVQRGRVIFYDKQNNHEHAEVDGLGDGTNGGVLAFYTKEDGGSVTEKLRINNKGAIGIGGANYGTSGQVLTSNASGSAVSWTSLPAAPLSKVYGYAYLGNSGSNFSENYTSNPSNIGVIFPFIVDNESTTGLFVNNVGSTTGFQIVIPRTGHYFISLNAVGGTQGPLTSNWFLGARILKNGTSVAFDQFGDDVFSGEGTFFINVKPHCIINAITGDIITFEVQGSGNNPFCFGLNGLDRQTYVTIHNVD